MLPDESAAPFCLVLARYGAIPQVARFGVSANQRQQIGTKLRHGAELVVETDRGPEIASVLDVLEAKIVAEDSAVTGNVLRAATSSDTTQFQENRRIADQDFVGWQRSLEKWQLQLQLIDVEWTLDREKVILYVLNGQDAETTRLALLAAAAGKGIIHVQPVASEGIVYSSQGQGCGSGSCNSGGCGH